MNGPREPYQDSLIDEVRQRRMELYESLGGNLKELFEAIRSVQREHPEKVGKPRARSGPPVKTA
jgi:hypothetical protein